MKHVILAFAALMCVTAPGMGQQERLPVRSYQPEELVSFTRDIPMRSALEILSTYAQKFERRIIIGTENFRGTIGVSVERMHWKRALEYILRSNMLKYIQHEKYYEIVPLQEQEEKPEEESDITYETREIEINAIFFQADYEALHELGIDWSTLKNGTVEVHALGASAVAQEFFNISASKTIRGKVKVEALLKAFESRSIGEVIAKPHIRVMEGEKGKIKVGKNFFLTVRDFAGNTRFSEYEAGIILTVTPTILGEGDSTFIHLDITAERSDVKPDIVGVTKDIAESRTQVLLLNGEETVIAGLLSQEEKNLRKGIPILKDLPWWFFGLRYLFGYESKTVSKKELVILIRARIVPMLFTRKVNRINIRNYFRNAARELESYRKGRTQTVRKRPVQRVRRKR